MPHLPRTGPIQDIVFVAVVVAGNNGLALSAVRGSQCYLFCSLEHAAYVSLVMKKST